MHSTLASLLLLASTLASAGAPDADRPLVDDTELQAAGMYAYWQAQLPIADGDAVKEAFLVDEVLYVTTVNGTVHALTADVGLIRWAQKIAEPGYPIRRPTHVRTRHGAGPTVVPTVAAVFVFDRFSGERLQTFVPPFPAGGSAVAVEQLLFMGGVDGKFYSLVFNQPFIPEPFKHWEVLAGGPVTASPSLYGEGMLLFASQSGTVFSCRAANKALNWTFRAGGPIMADPFVDESGVYVASMDRSLYKLRIGSGRMDWRFRMSAPLTDGPIVTAHTVYQHVLGQGLAAIDADSGTLKWRLPLARSFVAHTIKGDLIFMRDGRLLSVDNGTGEHRFSIDAPAVTVAAVNVRNDAAFLLGRDGRVLCARLDTVPYLRRQMAIAARAVLGGPSRGGVRIDRGKEGKAGRDAGAGMDDPLRSRRDRRP